MAISIKVHKKAAPQRPVVSFISAPTYHLAIRVDFGIKSCIIHRSRFAVHSTAIFVPVGIS